MVLFGVTGLTTCRCASQVTADGLLKHSHSLLGGFACLCALPPSEIVKIFLIPEQCVLRQRRCIETIITNVVCPAPTGHSGLGCLARNNSDTHWVLEECAKEEKAEGKAENKTQHISQSSRWKQKCSLSRWRSLPSALPKCKRFHGKNFFLDCVLVSVVCKKAPNKTQAPTNLPIGPHLHFQSISHPHNYLFAVCVCSFLPIGTLCCSLYAPRIVFAVEDIPSLPLTSG